MPDRHRRFSALLGASVQVLFALLAGTRSAAAEESARQFDIPSKPLAEAIMDFGVQAGLVVVAPSTLTSGKTGREVHGTMSFAEALRRLLSGSSLSYTRNRDGTITIQAQARAGPKGALVPAPRLHGKPLDNVGIDEIVVTATRRDDLVRNVPISMSAYDRRAMNELGVRSAADLAAATPGVEFSTANFPGNSKTSLAIRGIKADVGTSTTGIYIDDTPIQVRDIQEPFGAAYPHIFDLERLEVLRGPQGTLFGAGSEGGTLRFITPEPSLDRYEGYARLERANTRGGAASYEAGAALGGPIVENVSGFRASAWYRSDGGYVDRVNASTNAVLNSDTNRQRAEAARLALTFLPTPSVRVTPAFHYQNSRTDDTSTFWESLSHPGSNDLRSGKVLRQPTEDRFTLSSVRVEADLGFSKLVSATSYFERGSHALIDYTNYFQALFIGDPYPRLPGQNAPAHTRSNQHVLAQELRLQSVSPSERLTWVIGAFYADNRQSSSRKLEDTFAPVYLLEATGLTFEDIYGAGLYEGRYVFADDTRTSEKELAAYGDVDYRLSPNFTASIGVRVGRSDVTSSLSYAGPIVAPGPVQSRTEATETPLTPKFGLAYQARASTLLYATAAKGYRVGGGNFAVPDVQCAQDLASLGIRAVPSAYKSDSVWSYELGAKSRLSEGRVQLEVGAFHIDWDHIQSSLSLSCGFFFTSNFGRATSQGFDLAITIQPIPQLELELAVGYTDARYATTVGSGSQRIVTEGDTLGQTPWVLRFSPQYRFTLLGYPAYVDGNYVFRSHNGGRPVSHDPAIPATFNPTIPLDPATHWLRMHAGITLNPALDIALFVDNVLNAAPLLQRWHDSPDTNLYVDSTFRPRTLGLTATLRF